MAKVLSVYKSDQLLTNRQVPLTIDNTLTILMKIDDFESSATANALAASSCLACEQMKVAKKKDYEVFMRKYSLLINNYHNTAPLNKDSTLTINDFLKMKLRFKTNDLLNSIQQLITCIGCKTSVEKFYKQLNSNTTLTFHENSTLDPLKINVNDGFVYLNNDFLNPKALFNLFHIHGSKLDKILDAIPKNKKNRRCYLHSLDVHKIKNLNDWLEVWEIMDDECRRDILCVNNRYLMQTLDGYLRKHRFCSDCKNKVIRAYNLLTGELDVSKEKGYCASLYDGLKFENKNVYVKADKQYLMQLISRAEPEIQGSNRERHAKTIEIAQEEVLTCIGIYLYEKFHRIYQAMKSEEQTWQLLFYIGVYTLKKCFEVWHLYWHLPTTRLHLLVLKFELERVKCNKDETEEAQCVQAMPKKTTKKTKNSNKQKKEKIQDNKENEVKYESSNEEEEDEDETTAMKRRTNGNDTLKIDAGYSSGQESNASSNEVCFSTDSLICMADQCKCQQQDDIIACNEIVITQPEICGCDFDIINYSRIIEQNSSDQQLLDTQNSITDEEKNEYYANRRFYLQERNVHRMQLKEKFQSLQNFKLKPRSNNH